MSVMVRLSAHFGVDLYDVEAVPEGFIRRPRWSLWRHGLSTRVVGLEDESGEELVDRFEETLRNQLHFFEKNADVRRFLDEGRGFLFVSVSFEDRPGTLRMPSDFLAGWGALGGNVIVEIV
ncbi:hypothetical protein [Homoserinibacter sp. GY 40078]|uniref:hypothetical protein n=1 Tax=Homoserinibacter sp. GY 40078 TaxID=2603275 RepID=UPI0011C8CEDC|nr:hypothetical protein [Homoserinibacter sp. GY 40078]TXK18749.1 hypothetical protein FVQ89_02065 [Homoserinibacter sp. GY 40078]